MTIFVNCHLKTKYFVLHQIANNFLHLNINKEQNCIPNPCRQFFKILYDNVNIKYFV